MKTNATVRVTTITPDIATQWLSDMWGEQRNVRSNHVKKLAADMEHGKFRLSPDAILRVNGKLANGQHRLAAVVRSGIPHHFLVMESDDESLYKVLDSGLRRTVSDSLVGYCYSKTIPAVARWVQSYNAQSVKLYARGASEAEGNPTTQVDVIEFCKENYDALYEAISFCSPLYEKTTLLPLSMAGAIYFISASKEKAKSFLTEVYTGDGNTVATDLRNRLIANKGSRTQMNKGYMFALAIKAFRCFVGNHRPGTLKLMKDESFQPI